MRDDIEAWGGALGVLWHQDLILRELFEDLHYLSRDSVEVRYDYGNRAKEVIRHIGDREAAVLDVAHGIESVDELVASAERMFEADRALRRLYKEVGRMSRGVRALDLNIGQDFDGAFEPLVGIVHREVDWELDVELDHILSVVGVEGIRHLFHSANWLRHHAPTSLAPEGERWFERQPLASRFITAWNHMRDYPKATRGQRRQ